jgi:hypothetical protein
MTTTFRGSCSSLISYGNDLLTQNMFTLENRYGSRVNINVRKLEALLDPIAVLTGVMPQLQLTRITGVVSGGSILAKVPWDTSLVSDTRVIASSCVLSGNPITATPGTIINQEYGSRIHTAIGQVLCNDIVESFPPIGSFLVRPGQTLLLTITGSAVTSNASLTNNWILECAWDEESLGTFAISGNVSLGGNNIEGAKVVIVEASDESMTNAMVVDVRTTDSSGNWSSSIVSGRVGAAYVQYKSGSTYYTAPGSPFLES